MYRTMFAINEATRQNAKIYYITDEVGSSEKKQIIKQIKQNKQTRKK